MITLGFPNGEAFALKSQFPGDERVEPTGRAEKFLNSGAREARVEEEFSKGESKAVWRN
jgi:hypothetical protein